jgi:HSP20 family protein
MMDAMDDLISSSGAVNSSFPASRTLRSTTRTPWDAMEDATSFKLRLDMPGLTKEEVSVDVVEGNLSIKGEHKPVEGEDDWSSRSSGSYNITIKLPDNVKVDAIKAELKNGVLCVTAPKVEEVKKRVQVHVS